MIYTNLNQFPSDSGADRVGQQVQCAETGEVFVIANEGCTFNYATDEAGNIYSNEGSRIREQRALLQGYPIGAYVSSDGDRITDWKGTTLGTIVERSRVTLGRFSHIHGSYVNAYKVRDIFGQMWYGRGNPGISITLRPTKATKDAVIQRFDAMHRAGYQGDLAIEAMQRGYRHAFVFAQHAASAAFAANPMLREGF